MAIVPTPVLVMTLCIGASGASLTMGGSEVAFPGMESTVVRGAAEFAIVEIETFSSVPSPLIHVVCTVVTDVGTAGDGFGGVLTAVSTD